MTKLRAPQCRGAFGLAFKNAQGLTAAAVGHFAWGCFRCFCLNASGGEMVDAQGIEPWTSPV